MADFASTPPVSAERMSFFEVMLKAYTSPTTATFHSLARNPGANAGTAYLWVAVAAAVSALVSSVLFRVFPGNPMLEASRWLGDVEGYFDFGQYLAPSVFSIVITLICGVPIAAVMAVIVFAIVTGLLHLIAGLLGGKGDYGQLAFLLAAVQVPMTLFGSILAPIPFIGCLTFLITIYAIVLQVLSIEGVYQFGIGKAILVLLVPFILVCIVAACIAVGIAALVLPVFRETFNGTFPLP